MKPRCSPNLILSLLSSQEHRLFSASPCVAAFRLLCPRLAAASANVYVFNAAEHALKCQYVDRWRLTFLVGGGEGEGGVFFTFNVLLPPPRSPRGLHAVRPIHPAETPPLRQNYSLTRASFLPATPSGLSSERASTARQQGGGGGLTKGGGGE